MALHSLSEFLPCSQNTKKGRAWTRLNSLIADETSSRVTLRLHNNQKAAICLVVTRAQSSGPLTCMILTKNHWVVGVLLRSARDFSQAQTKLERPVAEQESQECRLSKQNSIRQRLRESMLGPFLGRSYYPLCLSGPGSTYLICNKGE